MTSTKTLTNSLGGALLLALVALGGACTADAGETMFIIHNQAPDTSCLLNANKNALFVSSGVLDTGVAAPYVFTPLVESRADVASQTDPLQRAIFVQGAEITLEIPDGAADVAALDAAGAINFSQRFSGTLEPGGLSNFAFEIIPSVVSEAIGANLSPTPPNNTVQVLAEVEMFGELAGGDVASPTFTYPITFCAGCRTPSCVGFVPPDPGGALNCFPGQDNYLVTNCCVDSANQLQCPAVPE